MGRAGDTTSKFATQRESTAYSLYTCAGTDRFLIDSPKKQIRV